MDKESACSTGGVWSVGWEDLEEALATYCSILAWRVPWTEEPGGFHRVIKSWTQLEAIEHTQSYYKIPAVFPEWYFLVAYLTYLLIYLSLCLLIPYPCFAPPSSLSPLVLYIAVCFVVIFTNLLFFFRYLKYIQCFASVWLISLSIIPSKSVCVVGEWQISIFHGWLLFHHVYLPHFLHPSMCWWTLRMLWFLTIVNNAAVNIGMNYCFHFIWMYTPEWNCWIKYSCFIFSVLRNFHVVFFRWLHQFTFLPAVFQGFPFLHILANVLLVVILSLFNRVLEFPKENGTNILWPITTCNRINIDIKLNLLFRRDFWIWLFFMTLVLLDTAYGTSLLQISVKHLTFEAKNSISNATSSSKCLKKTHSILNLVDLFYVILVHW